MAQRSFALPRSAWLALAAGALGMAIAGALLWARRPPQLTPLRITAGPADTSRALIARGLAGRLRAVGVPADAVAVDGDELAQLERREVDLALVSSVLRRATQRHVHEVAPLQLEALHLLVRSERAGAVGPTLAGLRGRRVAVEPEGTAGGVLARAVLGFAGLDGGAAGAVVEPLAIGELERRLDAGAPDALPDAVLLLATVPSRIALRLIQQADYRLLPLPFAEALRLRTILTQVEQGSFQTSELDVGDVVAMEIPAFVYGTDPPIPAAPLPTLGARLLLLGHEQVPTHAVELLLDTVYGSRFARLAHPPLAPSDLAHRPRQRRHPGTAAFLERGEPLLSAGDVDELNNTLGVAGALVGSGLFLWQALRQARSARRARLVAEHMLRVAGIEQRLVELELGSELALDDLSALQRELLELKREALDRFARGEIDGHRTLAELLAPVDGARDQVAGLLLHVREQVAERAAAEGRPVAAVWNEQAAGDGASDSSDSGPRDPERGGH